MNEDQNQNVNPAPENEDQGEVKKPENIGVTPGMELVVRPPDYEEIYNDFVKWYALPTYEKWEMLGVTEKQLKDPQSPYYKRPPYQTDFANKYGVHINTLTNWKKRFDFPHRVEYERMEWGKDKTSDVLAALFNRIARYGMAGDVSLWLAYVEGWTPKQVVEYKERFANDDIRAIISVLPAEEQKLFYDTIANALQRAELLRRRGSLQEPFREQSYSAS